MIIGTKPNKKIINLEDHPDYKKNKEKFDEDREGSYAIARYLYLYDTNVEAVRFQRPFSSIERTPYHYVMGYIQRLVRIDFEALNGSKDAELGIGVGKYIFIKKIRSGETLDLPELRLKDEEKPYAGSSPVGYYLKKNQVRNPVATVINYGEFPKRDEYEEVSLEDVGFTKYLVMESDF